MINSSHVTGTRRQFEQVVSVGFSVFSSYFSAVKKSLTCSIQFKECLTVLKGLMGKQVMCEL